MILNFNQTSNASRFCFDLKCLISDLLSCYINSWFYYSIRIGDCIYFNFQVSLIFQCKRFNSQKRFFHFCLNHVLNFQEVILSKKDILENLWIRFFFLSELISNKKISLTSAEITNNNLFVSAHYSSVQCLVCYSIRISDCVLSSGSAVCRSNLFCEVWTTQINPHAGISCYRKSTVCLTVFIIDQSATCDWMLWNRTEKLFPRSCRVRCFLSDLWSF